MAMTATQEDGAQDRVDPARPVAPQVADALRQAIVGGDLPPARRISEAEIAAHYGVSRQPVREAFIRLSVEGLLSVLPNRGTTVARIAVASVIEARFVREAVEADIVRLLAEDPDRPDMTALRAEIEAQRAACGDPRAFIALDDRFHRVLAETAGKGGIWRRVQGLKAQMDRVRVLSLTQFPAGQLVAQHAGLVERIAAGDRDGAESAMREHLRAVLSDLPAIIAAHPDFFDAPEEGRETKLVSIKGGKT
jgi:DNA-binding GntR family transcriptional regulator